MKLADRYTYECEDRDGRITTMNDGDLAGVVRFSLIPAAPLLPPHSIVGIPMIRRFCRAFEKVKFRDYLELPGMVTWETGNNILRTTADLRGILKAGDMIKKRHDGEKWWPVLQVAEDVVVLVGAYDGRTKTIESRGWQPKLLSEYVHCIVCSGFRIWVMSSDGRMLITPEDYELYL